MQVYFVTVLHVCFLLLLETRNGTHMDVAMLTFEPGLFAMCGTMTAHGTFTLCLSMRKPMMNTVSVGILVSLVLLVCKRT